MLLDEVELYYGLEFFVLNEWFLWRVGSGMVLVSGSGWWDGWYGWMDKGCAGVLSVGFRR